MRDIRTVRVCDGVVLGDGVVVEVHRLIKEASRIKIFTSLTKHGAGINSLCLSGRHQLEAIRKCHRRLARRACWVFSLCGTSKNLCVSEVCIVASIAYDRDTNLLSDTDVMSPRFGIYIVIPA